MFTLHFLARFRGGMRVMVVVVILVVVVVKNLIGMLTFQLLKRL